MYVCMYVCRYVESSYVRTHVRTYMYVGIKGYVCAGTSCLVFGVW